MKRDVSSSNRQQRLSPCSRSPESDPYKSLSYAFFTAQFMSVTLDLFIESGDDPAWHYSITSIEFVAALFLSTYQAVRLRRGFKGGYLRHNPKATISLLLSLCIQLYALALSAWWFDIENDKDTTHFEWSFFALGILWAFVNPMTYSAVAEAEEAAALAEAEGAPSTDARKGKGKKKKKKKQRMSPGAAAFDVFRRHLGRTPVLLTFGALFACAQAILTTYQGAIVNDLTRAVTRRDRDTGLLTATFDDVETLAGTLLVVWLAANASRLIFDVLSSIMFSKLECWLRGAVFERAVATAAEDGPSAGTGGSKGGKGSKGKGDPASEYQARYSSDVTGVVSLYSTLLNGVVVNVLLIISNFVFLVIYEKQVALVTLGLLVVGVTSGPTDLAGDAASDVQGLTTSGLADLSDAFKSGPVLRTTPNASKQIIKKHETEVLVPLERRLRRRIFFSNAVDTYMNFFASFLTVVVVITMSWQVFFGKMESSDFLGIFFVFKQLQKPAMKISGVIKSAVKKSANLERLNEAIFPGDEDDSDCDSGGNGNGNGNGGDLGSNGVGGRSTSKEGSGAGVGRAVALGGGDGEKAEAAPSSSSSSSSSDESEAAPGNLHGGDSTMAAAASAAAPVVVTLDDVKSGSVSGLSIKLSAGESVLLTGSRREDAAALLSGTTIWPGSAEKKGSGGNRIVVDGKALRSRSDVVDVAATVFSTPALLKGSVRWNVAVAADPNAGEESNDDAIRTALERAGITSAELSLLDGRADEDDDGDKGLDADVSAARSAWSDALLLRLSVARNLIRRPRPRIWVLPEFGVGSRLEGREWSDLLGLVRGIAAEDGAVAAVSSAADDSSSFRSEVDRVVTVEDDGLVECV